MRSKVLFLLLTVLFFTTRGIGQNNYNKKDFLAANIDSSVSPAQDFFIYANGGWIKKNPIPKEESAWGVGNLVQEDIYARLRKINADAIGSKAAQGTTEQKIGDFW